VAIELVLADSIDRLLAAAAAAPRQSFNAREEFGKRIRLGKVVVAAGSQALHTIVNLAQGRKDQHRCLDAFGAQLTDDGEPVPLWKHSIDDQHVVLPIESESEGLLAVRSLIGYMADLTECASDIIRGVAVVFNNQ
jgi:hypothetical protein